ncbi:UNVERIFIED_CONTAM: hypothetical protein GTU68_003415 [Idotea baltica]|nr:hypothetical protein [Idotea baltica]
MSKRFLGETFDIHGGGADLTFPHHENEVAQSECANDKSFANYWVHNGFLMVNGEKMSKSLGNFKTVRELLDEGVDGNVIRFAYMTTHYRKPLDFSDKLISDALQTLEKFAEFYDASHKSKLVAEVQEMLEDDLNTPLVIAKCHEYYKAAKKGDVSAIEQLNMTLCFLGLDLSSFNVKEDIPQEMDELRVARDLAKQNKDWATADEIRDTLKANGWAVEDGSEGSILKKIVR